MGTVEEPIAEPRPDDYVVLLAQVPERVADIVAGLDEPRRRYRHAPAFPTIHELVVHLAHTGTLVDALFRHVCIDGERSTDLRAAMDPPVPAPDDESEAELVDRFARDRRRTADLLRGLDATGWAARVEDVGLGDMSMLDICERVGRHEAAHLTQLRNLLALVPEPRDLGPIRPPKGGAGSNPTESGVEWGGAGSNPTE